MLLPAVPSFTLKKMGKEGGFEKERGRERARWLDEQRDAGKWRCREGWGKEMGLAATSETHKLGRWVYVKRKK